METRRRIRWLFVLIPAALLGFVSWQVSHSTGHDSYHFLGGRRPANVGVIGPGSWGAKEYRAYSWKEPWRVVAADAGKELTALGLKRQPNMEKRTGHVIWSTPLVGGGLHGFNAETQINILPGRSLPFTSRSPLSDGDSEWVTVLIESELPDTWPNIIRYCFFEIPD